MTENRSKWIETRPDSGEKPWKSRRFRMEVGAKKQLRRAHNSMKFRPPPRTPQKNLPCPSCLHFPEGGIADLCFWAYSGVENWQTGQFRPETDHNRQQNPQFWSPIFGWILGPYFSRLSVYFTIKAPSPQKLHSFVMESLCPDKFSQVWGEEDRSQ